MITYSLIVPIYNEAESLRELFRRLKLLLSQLDGEAEVILINDGSADQSSEIMHEIRAADSRFKLIEFSRNFGHQVAISAGMDFASGKAVVIMDADLQDPPEVVLEMAKQWKAGFEIVYAVRRARNGETWFKLATASIFYRSLGKLADVMIPVDVGDFRLVDQKAIKAFRSFRERSRFARGLFSWIGFRQTGVYYDREVRFAGETKYRLKQMLRLAFDAIMSFSNVPLRLVLKLGILVSFISFLFGIWAMFLKIAGGYVVSGWTSMTMAMCFIGGVQLFVMGMIGEYLGRIYDEVKDRPLYIVRSLEGFQSFTYHPSKAVVACDEDQPENKVAS